MIELFTEVVKTVSEILVVLSIPVLMILIYNMGKSSGEREMLTRLELRMREQKMERDIE